ncbi:MAG: hypothetical protein OJF49_001216 [Ktedonobacterales bacterium]|jgi:uncharacterized protein YggT (Ycf19 family)|nr:MAG: hypothetical protein OJF49_001216 [Ktedonobacterales bacterium]
MSGGPLHVIVFLFFGALVLALIVRMILGWLPLPQGNAVTRFFTNLTDPVLMPVARRIPRGSVGFLDLSYTIAFIFTWWVIVTLQFLTLSALPPGW